MADRNTVFRSLPGSWEWLVSVTAKKKGSSWWTRLRVLAFSCSTGLVTSSCRKNQIFALNWVQGRARFPGPRTASGFYGNCRIELSHAPFTESSGRLLTTVRCWRRDFLETRSRIDSSLPKQSNRSSGSSVRSERGLGMTLPAR